ncbi:MAG: hypothetical protein L3J50_09355, partial [Emcibacter sp.]|nr:hypothetical protein [Emcibacter sp.]
MIRLGAYRPGANRDVDAAIHYHPALEEFMAQKKIERSTLAEGYAQLEQILQNGPFGENPIDENS